MQLQIEYSTSRCKCREKVNSISTISFLHTVVRWEIENKREERKKKKEKTNKERRNKEEKEIKKKGKKKERGEERERQNKEERKKEIVFGSFL